MLSLSFSIADPNEVWIMEIIGKGNYELGAVWVARRVPDGFVCAHANQARITQFPLNSSDTLYSPDVISFARRIKIYHGSDEDFSFSDTYDPVTFEGARFCEARVYRYSSKYLKIISGSLLRIRNQTPQQFLRCYYG